MHTLRGCRPWVGAIHCPCVRRDPLRHTYEEERTILNERIYNFNPGPAVLPEEVLKEARAELLNFHGTGMSILEISHRAPAYDEVHQQTKADILALMGLGDDYDVVFTAGGASQTFALIPLNFASEAHPGSYALSGSFSEKAYEEAVRLGVGTVAASTKEENYVRVPVQEELRTAPDAAYLHICLNNTIYGTEYHYTPRTNGVPLIADMSSDILSRPWDFGSYDFIYAGVQKNLGPAGVVLNVAKKSLLEKSPAELPTMFRYSTFQKNDSLYNTPPVFAIYMVGKVAAWIKAQGGLAAMGKRNAEKAALLYDAIDSSDGFYRGHAEKNSRSRMNVTFRLRGAALEQKFAAEAQERGLAGLKGHRSVGGIRASVYNAMPIAGAEKLAAFMEEFRKANR